MVFIPKKKKGFHPRAKKTTVSKPTAPLKRVIQKVLNRNLETKVVTFFGPDAAQTQGVTADGTFAKVGYVSQNMTISSNQTDIKRMLPLVSLGTGRFQRVGDSIEPIYLETKIRISLNSILWSFIGAQGSGTPYPTRAGANILGRPYVPDPQNPPTNYGDYGFPLNDITVVVYCLTHKTYKDYASLNTMNVFSELLDDGQGNSTGFGSQTAPFFSHPWHGAMRINEAKYNVIKRFQTDLRKEMIVGGNTMPPGDPTNVVINNMNHKYAVELSCRLGKKDLPAKLKYDVDTPAASSTDPTNFAPFWVVGCYNKANLVTALSPILVTWLSTLKYKDA